MVSSAPRCGPGALPCLRVVGDAGEPPAQLDRGRELATLLVDGADRSGIRLGDDEHRWSMGTHCVAGNVLTGCCGDRRSDPEALVRLDEAAELFGVIDRQVTNAKPETVRETALD
jgi:hypothetical protein